MWMARSSAAHHWKFVVFLILSGIRSEKVAMNLLIILLSIILVVNTALLMLLILIQLPKKEAGAGQAFGGAATDALFGAGSGNALTKMTKYAMTVFFVLTLSLSIMNAQQNKGKKTALERTLAESKEAAPTVPKPLVASSNLAPSAGRPNTLTVSTNLLTTPPANTGATNSSTAPPAPAPAPDKG